MLPEMSASTSSGAGWMRGARQRVSHNSPPWRAMAASVAISAAAQLAELCDWLDLDGNLLLAEDPYEGVTCHEGVLSFAQAAETNGLRVRARRGRA